MRNKKNIIFAIILGLAIAGCSNGVKITKQSPQKLGNPGDTVSFLYTTSSSKKLSTTYGSNSLADDGGKLSINCTTAKTSGSGAIQNTYNSTFGGQQMTINANRDTTVTFTFTNPWMGSNVTYGNYTQINSVTFTAVAGSSTTYNVACTVDGVAATGDNSSFNETKTTCTFTPANDHKTGIIVITVSFASGSKGWYFDNLGINAEVPESSGETPTNHIISFNSMGGGDIDDALVEDGGTLSILPTPNKPNNEAQQIRYRFDGWYTVADENNPVFEDQNHFTSSTPVDSDITLFAKYTEIHYNVVTFNTNGGSSVGSQNVDDGELVIKPNDPHKADYLFNGWLTNNDASFDFESTVINSNITLNANWTTIPLQGSGFYVKVTQAQDLVDFGKYLFVYNDKAFNGLLDDLDSTPNTVDVDFEGDYIKKDSNTQSAYFIIDLTNGYVKSASSKYIGRTSYNNGLDSVYNPTSNYQHELSFDNSGNVVLTREIADGQEVTLKYNNADGQHKFRYYKSGQENIQLYKFVSGHTVTFVTNSDSSIDSIDVLDGETISLPADPTKSPEGGYSYTFEGWYTNIGLTVPFNESTPITSNLTLYAKYTAEAISSPRTYFNSASPIKSVHGKENINIQSGVDSLTFSQSGLSNESSITDVEIGGVTLNGQQGSNNNNAPKFYTNGNNMRVYVGNTFTFESATNITRIDFTFTTNYGSGLTVSTGSLENGVWTGESDSITFTNSNSGTTQVRIEAISITYGKQILSVSNVALRFGLSIPESAWESIRDHDGWTINDYGVMLMAEDDMDGYTSIQDAFEKNASSSILIDIHKCQNETPYADPYFDGSDYIFTVKVSFPNDSQYYDDVIYANPYIVVNGTYYFLDDDLYTSVQELADYYHGSSYEYLSDAALDYLRA